MVSDAIAGVINYVLKDNYEGSSASLVYDDFAKFPLCLMPAF